MGGLGMKTADRIGFFGLCLIAVLAGCTAKPDRMIFVPAGEFVMGTDDATLETVALDLGLPKPLTLDAAPAHRVDLPPFYIDQYEVSNGDYLQFVEAKGVSRLPHWKGGAVAPEQVRLPVVFVDWFEALAYCRWRGKRLPTEEEWEKAARDGDGRLYPWGNRFEVGFANVGGLKAGPLPVGSLPRGRSPYGVLDLVGNVWEWTADWYEAYPGSDYRSENYGERFRVLRGASFGGLGHFDSEELRALVAAEARVTYRWYFPENGAVDDVGFRCARSV